MTTNEEFIIKLYKREQELKKICYYHNVYDDRCKDLIQNLYVKLLLFKNIDKYVLDGEPNMYIVFMILRNMIYDQYKLNSKYRFVELENLDLSDEKQELEKFEFVLNEVETLTYWFDKNLMKLYIEHNHTIRSLAKETKIPAGAIQKVFRKFKLKCIEDIKNQKS